MEDVFERSKGWASVEVLGKVDMYGEGGGGVEEEEEG